MASRNRHWWIILALLCSAWLPPATTAAGDDEERTPHPVPVSRDLRVTAGEAAAQGLPILLVFSATRCPYCKELDEEILEPFLLGGHDRGRVIVRKIMLDSWESLVDFDGREQPARDFGMRYRISLTPTLLFVDSHGRELVPRMLGINTPELYGGYLDEAIDQANATLRQRKTP